MARSLGNERSKLMYKLDLSTLEEPDRDQLLLALATLTSFESWDQLRHCYNFSIEDARTVWRTAIDRLPRKNCTKGCSTASIG